VSDAFSLPSCLSGTSVMARILYRCVSCSILRPCESMHFCCAFLLCITAVHGCCGTRSLLCQTLDGVSGILQSVCYFSEERIASLSSSTTIIWQSELMKSFQSPQRAHFKDTLSMMHRGPVVHFYSIVEAHHSALAHTGNVGEITSSNQPGSLRRTKCPYCFNPLIQLIAW
jgi:hypothetical protein